VECRLAALCIAAKHGVPLEGVRTLRDVADALAARDGAEPAAAMGRLAGECAEGAAAAPAGLSLPALSGLLSCEEAELVASFFPDRAAQAAAVLADNASFKIWQRALHVFEEALRVMGFAGSVAAGGTPDGAELARLMDASHESCKTLFECSCEELDALVACCKSAGALGARLTGAGWGGCVVSAVREGEEEEFIARVKKSYYGGEMGMAEGEIEDGTIVVTAGGSGAGLLDVAQFKE
jgi:galactokinase